MTTGAWVRGFLAEDYGVDLESITWVTFEDPHLAEYREPANVERAPAGKELKQMLLDGEIDAAILGDVGRRGTAEAPDSGSRGGGAPLGARTWRRADQPHGGDPARRSLKSRPDVVREVYRLLKESRAAAALPTVADDPLRFGVERDARDRWNR